MPSVAEWGTLTSTHAVCLYPSPTCVLSGNLGGGRLISRILSSQILARCPLLLGRKKKKKKEKKTRAHEHPGKRLLV